MVVKAGLRDLELGIICMVGTFFITILIIICIGIFYKYWKKDTISKNENFILKNKLKREESQTYNRETVFHFNKNAFILKENDNSTLRYIVMYKAETEKLAIKIKDITIGDRTTSIKPHIAELKEIFFRILLNNNSTNSFITSERYTFTSKIIIEEMFIFSLKEIQLKGTSISIEVFVTLINNEFDLLLGWIDISLPNNASQYPYNENVTLQQVIRPIDLYLKPIGYTCISLSSLHDVIKVVILASNFDMEECKSKKKSKHFLYFNLQMKNEKDSDFLQFCKTSIKSAATIIEWNEIFLFQVLNEFKSNSFIDIEMWETCSEIITNSEQMTKLGSINIGISNIFSEVSQKHWNYILDNENQESSKWHPIRRS